ncbi:MAG TPA: hypothetical protein VG733_08615 [Chthoniobacteraceae bacterium]|nr:hypothetical protein [Chthoniobacteraceae bacterium]
MTPRATASDIIGSWRAPETEGIELGYFFYPDGVFILQAPRHRRFTMRGAWRLEEGGRLVITNVDDPDPTHSEAERELIGAEQHKIAITEITSDSMVWQPEDAERKVAFRRAGDLPRREEDVSWRRLFAPRFFGN